MLQIKPPKNVAGMTRPPLTLVSTTFRTYSPFNLIVYFYFALIVYGCSGENGPLNTEIYYPSGGNASLQDAVNILADGGTINIEPGVFYENVIIINKIVNLQGSNKKSVINGNGATCITITNSSGSSVSNLSLVNCEDGISTDSLITVNDNNFFNNVDGVDYESGGGGILDSNIFHMNADDAIDLDDDVSVNIFNNTISGSADDGIEIRLQPYTGAHITTTIQNNIIKLNASNGIQFIDYEINTNRSFLVEGNTFIDNGFNGISYSDNQITTPSFNMGDIAESVIISNNSFYGSVYSFTGSGSETEFMNNIIYSLNGDGNINTTNDLSGNENVFVDIQN